MAIKRCPQCNEILNEYDTICSWCGYSLKEEIAKESIERIKIKREQEEEEYYDYDEEPQIMSDKTEISSFEEPTSIVRNGIHPSSKKIEDSDIKEPATVIANPNLLKFKESKIEQTILDETIEKRQISGFFIRIIALFIDIILLAILGRFVLGKFWEERFAQMGYWGPLVGFIVSLFYFGLLNSKVGKGQTLGKMACGICVVNQEGDFISIFRSIIRSAILTAPFLLYNILWQVILRQNRLIGILCGILLISFIFGIFYFYIFNFRTRQSLHDIICNTYVIKGNFVGEEIKVLPIAGIHYLVFILFIIAGGISFNFIINKYLVGSETLGKEYKNLITLQTNLYKIENVISTKTSFRIGSIIEDGKFQKSILVKILLSKKPSSFEEVAKEAAKIVLNEYPEVEELSSIEIIISFGYDIGIARSYKNYNISRTPREWKLKLRGEYEN